MKAAVIYKSKYGSAETYAKWIAQELSADIFSADKITAENLQKYDTVIYGGGVYAGMISGLSVLAKNSESIKNARLFIFTVGATNPSDKAAANALKDGLSRTLTPEILKNAKVFNFHGALKYSKMGFIHRLVIGIMVKSVKNKPQAELTPDDMAMLKIKEQDADFITREAIKPLIKAVKIGQ